MFLLEMLNQLNLSIKFEIFKRVKILKKQPDLNLGMLLQLK